jgi:probable rRNA maturation factor
MSVRVELTVRRGTARPLPAAECRRLLVAALEAGGAPPNATVSLILSDDAELAALNEAHMGKAGPTDVLSFPLLPPAAYPPHPGQKPAVREAGPADAPAFVLPPGERVHLGDIVISVERAEAQAAEGRGGQTGDRRWSGAQELALLITHGALHLCGWDHAKPAEAAAMRVLESRLLAGSELEERAEGHEQGGQQRQPQHRA